MGRKRTQQQRDAFNKYQREYKRKRRMEILMLEEKNRQIVMQIQDAQTYCDETAFPLPKLPEFHFHPHPVAVQKGAPKAVYEYETEAEKRREKTKALNRRHQKQRYWRTKIDASNTINFHRYLLDEALPVALEAKRQAAAHILLFLSEQQRSE